MGGLGGRVGRWAVLDRVRGWVRTSVAQAG